MLDTATCFGPVLNTKIKQIQNMVEKIRTILIGYIKTYTASLHEVTALNADMC